MSDDPTPPPRHEIARGAAPEAWRALRRHTPARIALGRRGGSLPTQAVLDFTLAWAGARDAVHATFDADLAAAELATTGRQVVSVRSAAADPDQYLQRPDLGRRLDDDSRERLAALGRESGPSDVVLIVADGLSAQAAVSRGVDLAVGLARRLDADGLAIGPLTTARHARVALQDEIGGLLQARCAVILLGERPGLAAPDSLGAYVVFDPRPGRTDAERNCVSNIHAGGMSTAEATAAIARLIQGALDYRLGGVALSTAMQSGAALPGTGSNRDVKD